MVQTIAAVTTIGFTNTTARAFFERLRKSHVKTVIDVRLHNTSQLAGFAKASDLPFFLREIGNIDYLHQPLFAPTEAMLKAYRKDKDWNAYRKHFLRLLAERRIEARVTPQMLDGGCLLCSEAESHHCHRRLVGEYLNRKWDGALAILHL